MKYTAKILLTLPLLLLPLLLLLCCYCCRCRCCPEIEKLIISSFVFFTHTEVVGLLRAHPDHLEIGEDGVDVVRLFAKDALSKTRLVAAGARDVLESMRNSQQHSRNHGAIKSALANLD